MHKLNKREKTDYLKKNNKPLISNLGGQRTMEYHFQKLSYQLDGSVK